jgi:HSP20 family protein
MANVTRRNRPSTFNLRRDIDDVLEDFTTPRGFRRELDRLLSDDLSPRTMMMEMDRMFDDFGLPTNIRRRLEAVFEPLGIGSNMSTQMGMGSRREMFVPDVELVERDNEYLVNVDLPGVRADEMQISIDDSNVLTIRGERREEQTRQDRGYEYTERSYGVFMRSVELPRGVDTSRIEAELRDGVLRLHIPKTEQAARKIPVSSREGGRFAQGQGQQVQMPGQGQGQLNQPSQQSQQSRESGRDQPRVVNPGMNDVPRRDGRTQANSR